MTFSISARCPDTGAFGIAITSSSICVAARCAWVGPFGLVTTQNFTNPAFGPLGLSLLRQGHSAKGVLQTVTAGDVGLRWRQVAVIDRTGRVAWYSGEKSFATAAIAESDGCLAMGNILANEHVPQAMVTAFDESNGEPFAERLLRGLEAGLLAGGELSPVRSAGLQVADCQDWPVVDLRVDWADAPIGGLRSLWELYRPQQRDFLERALDPDSASL